MTKKSINGSANADFTYDILCDVEAALNAVRGKFYPDKDYGSKIRSICEMPREFYALCYARQALYNMDGVFVKSVRLNGSGYDFTLRINDEERQVRISA